MVNTTNTTTGSNQAAANSGMFGSVATKAGNKTQDMFVTLLMAQVKNQDPMKPMDNMDFTNQLAMFNQLSEMQKVNTNFDKLNQFNASMSQTSYLNLLDRKITALGSEIVVKNPGEPQDILFNLPKESGNTSISLVDSNGMVNATIKLGKRPAGDNAFVWDGLDEGGKPLEPGSYSVVISGKDADGADLSGSLYASGIVSTITNNNGTTILKLGNGQSVAVNDILKVETKPVAK